MVLFGGYTASIRVGKHLHFKRKVEAFMQTLGRHMLVEYYRCDAKRLANQQVIRRAMLEAVRRSNGTIVTDVFHSFSPHGVSGVVVIAESHVAVHTWPEHGYAAVDIFSCSSKLNRKIIQQFLKKAFASKQVSSIEIKRGIWVNHSTRGR